MDEMDAAREVIRRAAILEKIADELLHPENIGIYYLSFAEEDGFLGGAFVYASGPVSAVERTHELGINPGGEVAIWGPVPPPVDEALDRLLTKEEIETTRPKDISIEAISEEQEAHEGEDQCGATHPQVGDGRPCIRFKGHDEYDGQRNHVTQRGEWFA